MATSRRTVLKLYKTMMREALEFQSYNFRMYALRRIRDGFRANMGIANNTEINELVKFAQENLEIIKRQTVVGKLYSSDELIIEKCQRKDGQTQPSNV